MTNKLIVDFRHPAHINFFKPTIYRLKEEGWQIVLIGIDRGKVLKIIEKEMPEFKLHKIGRHRGVKWSIILEANILRFVKMFFFLLFNRFNIGISVSSFIMGAGAKITGMPNLQFYDDPEYKKHVFLQKLTSTKTYYPRIKKFGASIETFNALKEWAYLTPDYFEPNERVLDELGVKRGEYIFAREVIVSSFNYKGQGSNPIATFANQLPKDKKVLLSLEDKSSINKYPADWILLNEPLKDIHSLIYYSSLMISSGDSMAREASMLGVPSIYCGVREMTANKKMIEKEMLFHIKPEKTIAFVNKFLSGDIKLVQQDEFRNKLLIEWDDVTEFIIDKIKKYKK